MSFVTCAVASFAVEVSSRWRKTVACTYLSMVLMFKTVVKVFLKY